MSRIKTLLSRKQSSDDTRFTDVHEAVAEVAGQVQTNADNVEQRFTQLEQRQQQDIATLTQKLAASEQQLTDLKGTLDKTENFSQKRRPPATGGDGAESGLTDC